MCHGLLQQEEVSKCPGAVENIVLDEAQAGTKKWFTKRSQAA